MNIYYDKKQLESFVGGVSNAIEDTQDLIKYLKQFTKFGFGEDLLVEQAIYKMYSALDQLEEAIDTVGMGR